MFTKLAISVIAVLSFTAANAEYIRYNPPVEVEKNNKKFQELNTVDV